MAGIRGAWIYESERDAASVKHYHKVLSYTHVANTNHVLLPGSHQGELACDVIKSGGSQLWLLSWLLLGVVPSNSGSQLCIDLFNVL